MKKDDFSKGCEIIKEDSLEAEKILKEKCQETKELREKYCREIESLVINLLPLADTCEKCSMIFYLSEDWVSVKLRRKIREKLYSLVEEDNKSAKTYKDFKEIYLYAKFAKPKSRLHKEAEERYFKFMKIIFG